MKKFKLLIILFLFITVGCKIGNSKEERDNEFREYFENKYNIELDKKSYVEKCHTDCEYLGFYTINNDYNYTIQISKKASEYKDSYDIKAVEKRKELYNYIKGIRGNDIAENYLGFYSNTMSGVVAYSSIEKNQLYYIIKYNDNMDMDLEYKKDYEILKKAEELNDKYEIKEMIVAYIKDDRLNSSNWIEQFDIKDITDYGNIIFNITDYLNKPTYSYRISNYDKDGSLSTISLEEFKNLIKES